MTIRFSALTYSGATDLCIGYQLVGFAKAKTYTVGSWLEVWMENYVKIKLRPSTFKTSQGFLRTTLSRKSAASRWQNSLLWTCSDSTSTCWTAAG